MALPSTNTSEESPYHHQALSPGEFRLLEFKKFSRIESVARHTLRIVSGKPALHLVTSRCKLEDKPAFDAVSYVWGGAPASIPVPCNGGHILVTPTAYEMLEYLHLYRPDTTRLLWIDAICINQEDEHEKETQIPLMRRIYAYATQGVVWLGCPTPDMKRFVVDFARVNELAKTWTPTQRTNEPFWRGKGWPPEGDDFWIGLFHILDHEWFRRLWYV
jgi:hypothetical protein